VCAFAHDGSFAMSIAFIFGGVPVNVTFPVTVPPAARRALGASANVARAHSATLVTILIRIGIPPSKKEKSETISGRRFPGRWA
jgi:hypothetical protein